MKVHRYTYPASGKTVHHLRVRIPGWLFSLLVKRGAERCPLELVTERGKTHRLPESGFKKFDYWA